MPGKKPYFARRKPAHCPQCGQSRVVKIAYGMPSETLIEASNRDEVALGGCCMSGSDPSWQCLACETEIYPEHLRNIIAPDDADAS